MHDVGSLGTQGKRTRRLNQSPFTKSHLIWTLSDGFSCYHSYNIRWFKLKDPGLVWPFSTYYRPQEEITGFTVSSCLKLAVMFIERYSLQDCTELICLSIKLFFTSIHKWKVDQGMKIEENERKKERAIGQLFEKLRSKVAREFRHLYQREHLTKELQVWKTISVLCFPL